MTKFNSLNEQLNDFNSRIDQLDTAFSLMAQKLEEKFSLNFNLNKNNKKPEIIRIFDQNKDEDNNDKNFIPKTFIDSVNKRFELTHEHYKKLNEDSNIMEQNITNISDMLNQVNEQIDSSKKKEDEFIEEINKIKDQLNDLIELRNKEPKSNKGISQQDLNNINNYIDKKINELMEHLLKEEKEDKNINNEKDNQDKNNKRERELIKLMNKKVNQLNEKIELIESESNLQKKNFNMKFKEIDNMSQRLNELNDKLLEKLEKKDLEELKYKTQNNLDDIDNIKSKLDEINIYQKKVRNEIMDFHQRIESLTIEVNNLKDNYNQEKGDFTVIRKEYNTKVEDNGSYIIDDDKLKNMLSPFAEEIQKIIIEIENINMKIKELSEQNKLTLKKKYMEKIESNLNDKINLMENNLDMKYLKKSEFQKTAKSFEIQIKQLQGNSNNNNNINQKQESENWILAKQPLKCFNCASCEANLNNTTLQQNEPIAWNKYHGQYRIGQGFSNLLKKLNKRNFEEKELNQTEKRARLFDFSFENIGANNIIMMNNKIEKLKINNRFIEDRISFPMSVKKYKLHKVGKNLRKKQKSLDTIPLSDEEKEEKSVEDDGSPKILKITKLKNDESTNTNNNNFNANNNVKNKTGRNNENNNLNRVQSFPLY